MQVRIRVESSMLRFASTASWHTIDYILPLAHHHHRVLDYRQDQDSKPAPSHRPRCRAYSTWSPISKLVLDACNVNLALRSGGCVTGYNAVTPTWMRASKARTQL